MIWLFIHVAAYCTVGYEIADVTPRAIQARRKKRHQACLKSIMKLEIELGIGLDWALDQIDSLRPAISRRRVPGYSTIFEKVFRCLGCEKLVGFEDHYGLKKNGVEDRTHRLCNSCMRSRRFVAAPDDYDDPKRRGYDAHEYARTYAQKHNLRVGPR